MEIMGDYGRGINAAFAQVDRYTAEMAQTSGTFTVTKDNVLAAARIIQTQADALQDRLDAARWDLQIVAPGNDDVSRLIEPAWNDLLVRTDHSYANRVQQYVDGLTNLAQQCRESAKQYGYTDEQVAEALGTRSG